MGILLEIQKLPDIAQEKATKLLYFNFYRNLAIGKSRLVTRLQRKALKIVSHENEAS